MGGESWGGADKAVGGEHVNIIDNNSLRYLYKAVSVVCFLKNSYINYNL